MMEISEYERRREKNVEENRRMLMQLGLLQPFQEKKPELKHGNLFVKKPAAVIRKPSIEKPVVLPSRRSLRQSDCSIDVDYDDMNDSINGDYASSNSSSASGREKPPKRPNSYGHIEGVNVGDCWLTRLECSSAGIHRPTVAGIHPGPEGAYSIALSGGYEDNFDGGESFTYTGAGGRDLKGTKANPKNLRTAAQSKDQPFEGSNASLAASVKTRNPVRVIRGYKLQNPFAPEEGYRYDGLYQVEKYWIATGTAGFLVYRYALKRCENQDPPPWTRASGEMDKPENSDSTIIQKFPEVQKSLIVLLDSNCSSLTVDSDNNNTPKKGLTTSPETSNVNGVSNGFNSDATQNRSSGDSSVDNSNGFLESSIFSTSGIDMTPSKKSFPEKRLSKDNSPSKIPSPVKMTAQNQIPFVAPSTSKPTNSRDREEPSGPEKDVLKKKAAVRKRELREINDKVCVVRAVKLDSQDHPYHRAAPSPEIPFVDDLSFLNGKKRSQNVNVQKGKRSSSPEDFAKICEELCNELPKAGEVKRIKFSFDNLINENKMQDNANKLKRKKVSRSPRKSSLVTSRDKKRKVEEPSEQQKTAVQRDSSTYQKLLHGFVNGFGSDSAEENVLGWDLEEEFFKGWSESEIVESREISTRFADFLFRFAEHSEENPWAGWDIVHRRSIILNGFLIDKVSREKASDSERESEEFLGF